jgi:nucleotide-binding universal stress UspA family protein
MSFRRRLCSADRVQHIQYSRILVPLDGSVTAEIVLPHALHLACLEHATATLLFVITSLEEIRGIGGQIVSIDEQWEACRIRALAYLRSVQQRPEWRDVTVQLATETGAAAERILACAAAEQSDVIVIATHGHSGFKRWMLGSVADKVLHASDRPVLLVNANPRTTSA